MNRSIDQLLVILNQIFVLVVILAGIWIVLHNIFSETEEGVSIPESITRIIPSEGN